MKLFAAPVQGCTDATYRHFHSKIYGCADAIFSHYASVLCGDCRLLSRIKPFWDYLEPETGHKIHKTIGKARTIAAYLAAVRSIG